MSNVINIADLPRGCAPDAIVERNFVGASNERTENYGVCDTILTTNEGTVACKWQVADVSRALHSISKTTIRD